MLKRVGFVVLVLFGLLYAENAKIDSLLNQLNKKNDKVAKILFDLGYEYYISGEYDKSTIYFKKAADEALKKKEYLLFIKSMYNLSSNQEEIGYKEKAIKTYQKIFPIIKKEKKMVAIYNFYCGILYFNLGEYEKSKEYFFKVKSYFKKIKKYNEYYYRSVIKIAQVYSNLGKSQKTISILLNAIEEAKNQKKWDILYELNLSLANEYYSNEIKDKALKIYYELLSEKKYKPADSQKAFIYSMIATINTETNKLIAEKYIKKALDIYKNQNSYPDLEQAYNSLAIIMADKGDKKKALKYYNEAIKYADKIKDNYLKSITLSNIGEIYREDKNYELALQYYNKALSLYKKEFLDEDLLAVISLNIATVFYEQKSYKKAFNMLKKIDKLNKFSIQKSTWKEIFSLYSKLYEKRGNYKKSLEYIKKYLDIEKEINANSIQENINKLQMKLETMHIEEELKILKKDKKINELQIQKEKYKNRYYFIILLFLFSVLIVFSYHYYNTTKTNKKIKKMNKKLEELSRKDPLTKLSNRRDILEKVEYEIIRAKRNKVPISFLLCDIDHFKKINDKYGHDCGDMVLVKIAQIFRKTLRQQDLISRWGGEEFLIVLPQTKRENAYEVSEKIRKNIEATKFKYKNFTLKVTITIGISEYEADSTIDEIIKRADMALYIGKARGRNCSVQIL